MDGTSYPLGDTYPSVNGKPPVQKTGDAANFGLFKNNCKHLRPVPRLTSLDPQWPDFSL